MDVIFEVVDFSGRNIRLSGKQYKHIIRKHPLVEKYFEEIKETLRGPNHVTYSNVDVSIRYYYKYYKKLKSPHKYIFVVVKYLNGNGFVVSAYFEKNIK